MTNEISKVINLLKFYKEKDQEVEFFLRRGKVTGTILELPGFFRNHILIGCADGAQLKLFPEDLNTSSILPKGILEDSKTNRKGIPLSVRNSLWNEYFGNNFKGSCDVCGKEITRDTFEAGHIVSAANGGDDNIENLRPLCRSCNRSMGAENLNKFKKKYY